jgi:hypothetical protein
MATPDFGFNSAGYRRCQNHQPWKPMPSTFLMRLEAHRHIKCVTAEIDLQPDGTVKPISVVYTDLELNSFRPGYDAAAVEELVGRLQTFQKTHHQPLRILTVRDASTRQDSEANQ